jgi:hypothetical protein
VDVGDVPVDGVRRADVGEPDQRVDPDGRPHPKNKSVPAPGPASAHAAARALPRSRPSPSRCGTAARDARRRLAGARVAAGRAARTHARRSGSPAPPRTASSRATGSAGGEIGEKRLAANSGRVASLSLGATRSVARPQGGIRKRTCTCRRHARRLRADVRGGRHALGAFVAAAPALPHDLAEWPRDRAGSHQPSARRWSARRVSAD